MEDDTFPMWAIVTIAFSLLIATTATIGILYYRYLSNDYLLFELLILFPEIINLFF